MSPGVTAPEPIGALLMAVAGIAWGVYSLLGRKAADPTRATAWTFLLKETLVLLTSLIFMQQFHATSFGIMLAIASGVVASGIGYVIW